MQNQDTFGIVADFSLGLINRTGAFVVASDIVGECDDLISSVSYWRLGHAPRGVWRKIVARLMLREYRHLEGSSRMLIRRPGSGPMKTLFLDPLYVLRAPLTVDDIVLCHDVGPITHSSLFDARTVRWYRKAYERIRDAGCGLVFVSEHGRNEFRRLYGSDFRFMEVITLYARPLPKSAEQAPVSGVTRPFLLIVGALEQRKNHKRTIDAFLATTDANGFDLVMCGPRGNSASEVEDYASRSDRIHLLGRVSDAKLSWLYAHATGFVLPSLLEGFGVPVIEAAERGLACVVSRDSAQAEAIGSHAILVDPEDIGSIGQGISKLIKLGDAEKKRLISAGQTHAKNLSRDRFVASWRSLLIRERQAS